MTCRLEARWSRNWIRRQNGVSDHFSFPSGRILKIWKICWIFCLQTATNYRLMVLGRDYLVVVVRSGEHKLSTENRKYGMKMTCGRGLLKFWHVHHPNDQAVASSSTRELTWDQYCVKLIKKIYWNSSGLTVIMDRLWYNNINLYY